MYFIFYPDKCSVQFQLIDYLGNSTDLLLIFTTRTHISLRKLVKVQQKQNTRDIGKEIKAKKYVQKLLTDYFSEASEAVPKRTAEAETQDLPSPTLETHDFNIIPTHSNDTELLSPLTHAPLALSNAEYEGMYYISGYYGRSLPLTDHLQEKGELTSRYTSGLLHEIYLEDFQIFDLLEGCGLQKKGGFSVKIFFLVLYYLYFTLCSSFARFAYISSEEFSILINNLAKPKPDTLRKFLKRTITMDLAAQFSNSLYFQINHLDWRIGVAAYLDEHFVIYQGLKKMAKGKSGAKNKVEKGFYRYYLTCGLFSIPLFCMPKDGRTRLEKVIVELLATYTALVQKRLQLIIFDRGIKSFKTLKKLQALGYHFICWSFPYKTIEVAIKRRHRLKMSKLSKLLTDLLQLRETPALPVKLTAKDAQLHQYFKELLPTAALTRLLREQEMKDQGTRKWNRRDFVRIREVHISFEGYGAIRTLILEKRSGERIAVFTDIPAHIAHPIEILMALKKRQKIEDYFAYKRAIQGDYIPFWELQTAPLQKTAFNYELKKPGPEEGAKFEKRIKRIRTDLKTIQSTARRWKTLSTKGKISKKTLHKQESELAKKAKSKQTELKEIRAFLRWAQNSKRPRYFDQFEPLMELNPRIELFLNAINDLFFVNSRRIASDWGNSLRWAKRNNKVTIPERTLQEISNYTPEKLNDILLKGGGKAFLNPNANNEIIVQLHTELYHKDEILIAPYLEMLNQLKSNHKFCFDTKFSMKFSNYSLSIPKSVKLVGYSPS